MNEKCYCGGDKVEPERHANCWRAYVAGLRRAMYMRIEAISAEIEWAERGRG